jgi:hypothetical protein
MAIGGAGILVFVCSVPIWERPISDGYWMVLGLIGLTVLNWQNTDQSRVPLQIR